MTFEKFQAMACSSKVPFPEKLYCDSSSGDLIGSYIMVDSRSRDFSELLVSQEAVSPYVYLNANRTHSNLLVYCEGTPELIPAETWRSVITEALSRNPHATLTASMLGAECSQSAEMICSDMKKIAMKVARDLAGWIIFTERGGVWTISARCVRHVDPETPTTVSASPMGSTGRYSKWTSDCSNQWEIRGRISTQSILPWIDHAGMDTRWRSLLSQMGCFDSGESKPVSVVLRPVISTPTKGTLPTVDESSISGVSTMASPPSSPHQAPTYSGNVTQESVNLFCWNVACTNNVCDKKSTTLTSPKFRYNDAEYIATLSGWHQTLAAEEYQPFMKVSLVRIVEEERKSDAVLFSVTVDGCTSSGLKRMGPEGIFEVVFDRSRRLTGYGDEMSIKIDFAIGS